MTLDASQPSRPHSYSSLSTLQQCERKWALTYREGLRQAGPTPWALLRGLGWHAVMSQEALRWGQNAGSLLHEAPRSIEIWDGLECSLGLDVCDTISNWELDQESEYLDAMREEYGGLLSDRLDNLRSRFMGGQRLENLFGKPLLVEYTWTREMPNGLSLTGRTDLVYLDEETDQVVVRDWKLNQAWPQTSPAIEDLINSQNHLGAWGVAPMLREHGLVPSAVEYARARFKKPATPTLTKATAKSPARLSKSTTDYDAYTYRYFAHSDEAAEVGYEFDEAYYAELLTQRDKWFRVSRKPLLQNVYSQHVISAMRQAERAESITTENSVPSYGSHCAFCQFSQLCRADLVGGRMPYDEIVPSDFGLRRKAEGAVH